MRCPLPVARHCGNKAWRGGGLQGASGVQSYCFFPTWRGLGRKYFHARRLVGRQKMATGAPPAAHERKNLHRAHPSKPSVQCSLCLARGPRRRPLWCAQTVGEETSTCGGKWPKWGSISSVLVTNKSFGLKNGRFGPHSATHYPSGVYLHSGRMRKTGH